MNFGKDMIRETLKMNKMIMAIIPKDEGELVLDALIEAGHTATYIETKGGMLRQSQYTLFIAINSDDLDSVCKIISVNCKVDMVIKEQEPAQLDMPEYFGVNNLGGAVVFIWNLNRVNIY